VITTVVGYVLGYVLGYDPRLSRSEHDHRRGRSEVRTTFSIQSCSEIMRVCCEDDVAQYVVRYVRGGDRIRVLGDLKLRAWTNRDGSPRSETLIYADDITPLREDDE
jgi:hypothetical protein